MFEILVTFNPVYVFSYLDVAEEFRVWRLASIW
jgi:hypothetical protein